MLFIRYLSSHQTSDDQRPPADTAEKVLVPACGQHAAVRRRPPARSGPGLLCLINIVFVRGRQFPARIGLNFEPAACVTQRER